MPQKYKISYTYANITAKMWHFSAKMPHFFRVWWGQNSLILCLKLLNHLRITYKSPKNHLRITKDYPLNDGKTG